MEKAFVYGMSVEGSNFTDRIEETKRIKADIEHGINVILISPRHMGKTSDGEYFPKQTYAFLYVR